MAYRDLGGFKHDRRLERQGLMIVINKKKT